MSYQGKRGRAGFRPYKKVAPVVRGSAYKPIENLTKMQSDIIDDVVNGSGSLVVSALAGTSKTTVAVESMRKLPEYKDILYTIFANRNAREAESKCEDRIAVSTCHAFGNRAIKAAYGKVEVDSRGEKADAIARALLGPEDEKTDLRYSFVNALGFAKGYLCETHEQVKTMIEDRAIDTGTLTEDEFSENILKALDLSAQQYNRIDFHDMIWLPIKKNLRVPQYDVVFGDEWQDLSPARIELALRAIKPNGKLVAIGDPNQRIYEFAGAAEDAIGDAIKRTNAHTLPLNMTFRCAKNIVALAQSIVPEYVAAPSNEDGVVADRSIMDMMMSEDEGGAGPGDFILSRTNAPLVGLCLQFLKEGRKASVLGKDLGNSLLYMIKRSEAGDVNGFVMWLDTWKNTECARLIAKNKDCQHIEDRYDCMIAFCEGTNDLFDVRDRITKMFADEDKHEDRIMLSTVHKAKGLESSRVYLLRKTFKPEKNKGEERIFYVGITRAKSELYMVHQ